MKIKKKANKYKNDALKEKILRVWKESTAIPRPCILCEELTMGRGVFAPEDPQAFGAPDGHEGAFLYPICSMCNELPKDKTLPIIRRVIFSEMWARGSGLN